MGRVHGFWKMWSLNEYCINVMNNVPQFGPHRLMFHCVKSFRKVVLVFIMIALPKA